MEVSVDNLATVARSNVARITGLEDAVQRFTDAQDAARQAEAKQYRRMEWRLQILTFVVAVAAVVVPIVVTLLHTR